MTIGEYLHSHRISQGLTLRDFCKKHGFNPIVWSRLERDVFWKTKTEGGLLDSLPLFPHKTDGSRLSREECIKLIAMISEQA